LKHYTPGFPFSVTRSPVNSRGQPWTLEGHKASFFKLINEWEEADYVAIDDPAQVERLVTTLKQSL
jgi:hypothetical protein